jgi:hypothetical protein
MKRHFSLKALTFGLLAGALILSGCATPETRISEHPDLYHSLSPSDQALVTQGQIRPGMSRNAVWLAWGSPDQKILGNMRGRTTETWLYVYYSSYPYYPYYGPYYPYGPGIGYTLGYTTVSTSKETVHRHGDRTYVFCGSPFYDPFFYSVPVSMPYPGKLVTFSKGRVMSFQYLAPN